MEQAIKERAKLVVLGLDHQALADQLLLNQPYLGQKIANATDLAEAESRVMLAEVLRFLSLTCVYGALSPPYRLDLAWHEFILFTAVYAEWCQKFLGRFIHHHPGGNPVENQNQLNRALKWYALHFGTPRPLYWGDHGYFSEPTDCGACAST